MGTDGRGRRGARRGLRSRQGGRSKERNRGTGEAEAAQGECRRRVPREERDTQRGGAGLELRCPEEGDEASSPTIFLLPGNQVFPFRVVPNFP